MVKTMTVSDIFDDSYRAKFRLLRLTTFIGYLEKHIAADEEALLPVEELVKAAVDEQLQERRIRQINKAIADSQIPYPQATIAEIEYPAGRGINAKRMARYANADWHTPTTVVIRSATGGGKTYIASAIGVAACINGYTVHYIRFYDLPRMLAVTRADAYKHEETLSTLIDVDLLIIDDFAIVAIDASTQSDLLAILGARDNRRSTIFVTQSGPSHWSQAMPGILASDSIINRMTAAAKRVELGDLDMRTLYGQRARQTPDYWE